MHLCFLKCLNAAGGHVLESGKHQSVILKLLLDRVRHHCCTFTGMTERGPFANGLTQIAHLSLGGRCTSSSATQSPMQFRKFVKPSVSVSFVESYHSNCHSTDMHVLAAELILRPHFGILLFASRHFNHKSGHFLSHNCTKETMQPSLKITQRNAKYTRQMKDAME